MLPRKFNSKNPKLNSDSNSVLGRNLKIAIVAAQYNPEFVDTLLDYTVATLSQHESSKIDAVRVPGSFEIPTVVAKLARSRKYHAIIALGVVFQGKTSHAEHITMAATINLQRISVETGIPVIHQILTPKNTRDAKARVKIRGVEAAETALKMARILSKI